MEIIKQGADLEAIQKKEFHCNYCGCEFIANKNEYKTESGCRNDCYCISECPNCKRKVYSEI